VRLCSHGNDLPVNPETKEQAPMKTHILPALLGAVVLGLSLGAAAFAAAPGNTAPPQITGTAKVGQTLTVSNGTWTDAPTDYTYQWQRCTSSTSCADITGATKQTYVVRTADATRTLRAVVTAANADGRSTANSPQTGTVSSSGGPRSTARPTVSGDATPGGVLTVSEGSWSGAPTSFAYQWLQCSGAGAACTRIFGATHRSYTVRFADVYSSLRVDVTAKNASGSTTIRSTKSDIVVPVEPVATPGNKAPTIVFLSLKRLGQRVYARFRVCDDAAKGVEVIERDAKTGKLAYVRRFTVTPNRCVVATRSFFPAPRFRTKGRYVVTLRAVDKSGASSRFVSRSLVRH
jgi:hypothetical protein